MFLGFGLYVFIWLDLIVLVIKWFNLIVDKFFFNILFFLLDIMKSFFFWLYKFVMVLVIFVNL